MKPTDDDPADGLAEADLQRDQLVLLEMEPIQPDPLAAAVAGLPVRPGTVAADLAADRPVDVADVWDAWLRRKKPETVRKYLGAVVELSRYLFAPSIDPTTGERLPVTQRILAPRPAPADRDAAARETLIRLCSASMRAARSTVAEWIDWQVAAGLAPKTIRQRASALRSFIEVAAAAGLVEWTLVVTNLPEDRVADRTARIGPEWDDVRQMVATARHRPDSPKQRRDLAVIELLVTTGLRRFQIAGIRIADVDLDRRMVTVARKRSEDTHDAPLTASVVRALGRWLEEYQPGSPAAPLFVACTKSGRLKTSAMSANAISDLVRQVSIDTTGLPTSPHRIRHSVATRTRAHHGVDHARAQLGHEDRRTTEIYLDEERNLRLAAAREAAEDLAADLDDRAHGPVDG
jgi:integrase